MKTNEMKRNKTAIIRDYGNNNNNNNNRQR